MRRVALVVMTIGVLVMAAGVIGMVTTGGDDASTPPEAAAPGTSTTSTSTTSSTTTTSEATTTSPEAAVRAFVPELVAAIRSGDNGFKFDRLHPLVLARYGDATCRNGLSAAQPTFAMDVVSVGAPEPWAWETDGLSTVVTATPVEVKRTGADGAVVDAVIHLADAEGELRWFTDCGTPSSS